MGWAFASGRGAKGDPNWSYDTHGGGVAVPTTTVEEKRRIDKLVGDELERRAALQKEKIDQTRRELLLEVDAAKQQAEATLATMAREHEEALFVLEERHKTHMGKCAARWDGERQEMRKAMDRLGGEHQLRHNETTSEFHDWQRETDREKSLEQRMHEQTVASLKARLMGLDQAVAEVAAQGAAGRLCFEFATIGLEGRGGQWDAMMCDGHPGPNPNPSPVPKP